MFTRSNQERRKITFFGQEDLHLVPCPVEGMSEEARKAMWEDENSPFKQIFDEFFGNYNPERKPPPPNQAE